MKRFQPNKIFYCALRFFILTPYTATQVAAAATAGYKHPIHQIKTDHRILRKEDLLLDSDVLNKVWILRRVMAPMNSVDSMDFLLDKMRGTKSNKDFLEVMNS